VKTNENSHEITANLALLDLLEIKGFIVALTQRGQDWDRLPPQAELGVRLNSGV